MNIKKFKGLVRDFLERLKRTDISVEEVKYAIGRIDPESDAYLALMKLIHAQLDVEIGVACAPDQSNESRQFAAGRCAMVMDILTMIESARISGQRLIEEEKARVAA
jgi:hypothetical protein